MEMDPILPVQEKHTDADQVRHIFVVIIPVDRLEPVKLFISFAYDLLQKMSRILCSVAIGMDSRLFNIIEVVIHKILTYIAKLTLVCLIVLIDSCQFLPWHAGRLEVFQFYIIFF